MRYHHVVCAVVLLSAALVAPPMNAEEHLWRVSVDSAGNQGLNTSASSSTSGDGRFVAFASEANNLVSGDTNFVADVFVHDRRTGLTTRVSVDSAGNQSSGGPSGQPSISKDGRYVAFTSDANNLVPGDTNFVADVFLHDRLTGATTRLNVDNSGTQASGGASGEPSISGDGRHVCFTSEANNLVPGDTNFSADVFVRDLQGFFTVRLSVDSSGNQSTGGPSGQPSISDDGRFVAFASEANNLVPNDTNFRADVFVRDRLTATTSRVSVDSSGTQGQNASGSPSISGDGVVVAFSSVANNLVPNDTNFREDVFVHDRATASTTRVSVSSGGDQGQNASSDPSISGDGRVIAFASEANNLVPNDTNFHEDIFTHDRDTATTRRINLGPSGVQAQAPSGEAAISGDGRLVAFSSLANNLVPNDTNFHSDVFIQGPWLILEADPDSVTTGDPIALTTWTGQASGLAALYVFEFNGTPLSLRLFLGRFDATGELVLSGTIPPGLSGSEVVFQTIGFDPDGDLGLSNREAVQFF